MTSIGRGCGKLYLTGEFAVMSTLGAAVIAGVNRYVSATATLVSTDSDETTGIVHSAYYDEQGRRLSGGVLEGEQDIVAHAISLVYRLGVQRGARWARHAVDIDIVSGLDDKASGQKFGLGSSGAVAVAVVRAVASEIDLALSDLEVFKLAFLATIASGAAGSGGDIACSSHGGVVFYRRPEPDALVELSALAATDPAGALARKWPNLQIESRADLSELSLLVGWTGTPVKTDSQLAKAGPVDEVRTADGGRFVTAVASLSEKLWRGLAEHDRAACMEALWENRRLLQDYESQRGVCIETDRLERLADIANAHGAAGKSSGSGGGDCGIAVLPSGGDAETILRQWASAGIRPLDLELAVDFKTQVFNKQNSRITRKGL